MQKPLLVALSVLVLSLLAFLPVAHAQTVVATIPLGSQNLNEGALGPPVFDPANGNIYVSALGTEDEGTVSVISGSTNTVTSILGLSTAQFKGLPGPGVLDPSNGDIYVANGPVINVISGATNEIVQNISGMDFSGSTSLAFDSANGMLYAPELVQSSLAVVDTANNSVVATVSIPSGAGENSPAVDPANGDVYVAGFNATTVVSGTTNAIVATIPFTNGASYLAVDPSTGSVIATSTGAIVMISSSNHVTANLTTTAGAAYPVFDPSDSDFYLLGSTSNVLVFSPSSNSIVGNVNLNFQQQNGTATGLAIDGANGDVFATFDVSGVIVNDHSITATFGDVISGTSVLGQVQVSNSSSTAQDGGGSAVFDTSNGDFYVPNIDGTVSVVNPQVTSAPPSTTTTTSTKASSTALPPSYLLLLLVASLVPITLFYVGGRRGPKSFSA